MIRKLLSCIFIFLLLLGQADAGEWKAAKYAGEFMSIGGGARALGMGGAYVALANDVTAGYWNPAGLSVIEYPQIAAMHAERFEGVVNFDYAGVAIPFGKKSTLALNVIRTGVDDIPQTALLNPSIGKYEIYNENGKTIRNVPYVEKWLSYAGWAWYASYARQKSDRFSYGVSAKVVHKGGGENSAWGLGFDAGFQWNPLKTLFVGAILQDATSTMLAWNNGTNELIIPTLKCGLAMPMYKSWLRGTITPVADIDFRFEGRDVASQVNMGSVSADFHLGFEYDFRSLFAVRVGYDVGYPTAGLGVHLPKLDVDYAFHSHSELGDTHRISLRLTIEELKFKRR